MTRVLCRIVAWSVFHPWHSISIWIIAATLAFPFTVLLQERLTASSTIPGTESQRAEDAAAEKLGLALERSAVLVLTGIRPTHVEADRTLLATSTEAIRALPEIDSAVSVLDWPSGLMLGNGDIGALVLVKVREGADAESLEQALRTIAAGIATDPGNRDSRAEIHWTGAFFLQADLIAASEKGAREGEMMALPAILVMLVVVFGRLRAALCPIITAVFAILVAVGGAGLLAVSTGWAPSVLIQNVASLIGLGLTIDYALLTLTEFRRASVAGLSPREAALAGASKSAPTILLAGASVMMGFFGLLVVPIGEIFSIGVGGILASCLAVCAATTFLPALLALLAPQIARAGAPVGSNSGERFWKAVATTVSALPVPFLLGVAILLTILALPAQSLRITLPDEAWLPQESESARGLDTLERIGRRGLINEILVVAEMPDGESFLNARGWTNARKLYTTLVGTEGVTNVVALPPSLPKGVSAKMLEGLPRRLLDPFLSADNSTMLFRILPANNADYAALTALVGRIRATIADAALVPNALRVWVGGLPASTLDYVQITRAWTPYVIGLVILGAFLMLSLAFRAPFIALKAVLLNLFSIAAAFGLATLVFIDGYGAAILGATPVEGVLPAIPLVVFCAVFGVSMDYEVFLIKRVATLRHEGAGEAEAITDGLAKTGMIITGAAAIMVIVFGAFVVTGVLLVKMLGFTLAAAVLIDATMVRALMSPALMRVAGSWNWWPDRQG